MRLRALLATAALAAATVVALPAIATPPAAECPEGTFLAKYELDDDITLEEGDDVIDFTVTSTNDDGEVLSFLWSSSEPVSLLAVKAGKETTTVVTDGTSGSFTVPSRYAVSHVTFCLGEDDGEITPAGKALQICWAPEEGGTFSATFAYQNLSVDQDGNFVSVDRETAGFGTSYASLADQFPTTFEPTPDAGTFDGIEFTVTGWDGASALTFELFGTTKQFPADPEGNAPSNICI